MKELFGRKHQLITTRGKSVVAMLSIAVASVVLASCTSQDAVAPSAPTVQAANGVVGSVMSLGTSLTSSATGLLRSSPMQEPVTRSVTVDRDGGVLRVPEAGLTITIPPNAVSSRVTIWVTSLPGNAVAYEFGPHGLKFAVPLTFSQSLRGTQAKNDSEFTGGYFKTLSQVNLFTGDAQVDEAIVARVINGAVQFNISHFSGYMVSTGRSTNTASSSPMDAMK